MNIPRFGIPLLLLSALPAQWSQATPATNPGNRGAHGMASDLVGNTLLFGGVASVSPLNQTWLWNGGNWTQLTPAASPSARQQMEVVYDMARNRYVVYGGWTSAFSTGNANNQTWEFDGTTWTQMTPISNAGNICKYAACYDIARQRVVLYGGAANGLPLNLSNTWEYDGTTWAQVPGASTPGPRQDAAMCYSVALSRVVMFGGIDVQSGGNDTTWLFDGTSWTAAPIAGPKPPARTLAKMVYDMARNVCVLAGGSDPTTGNALNDTWEFNGSTWTQISSTAPAVRAFGMAYDNLHQQVVQYGGFNASSQVSNQTWLFGAQSTAYGVGCAGSNGVPALASNGGPRLGQPWTATVANLNPTYNFAILALGFSQLPGVDLGPLLGMYGCNGYAAPDLLLTMASGAPGSASWTWSGVAGPVGAQFFCQALCLDPGVTSFGFTISNALSATLGY